MTTIAIFIVGTWLGFGLGLVFAGFARRERSSGKIKDLDPESLEYKSSRDLIIAAHAD
jgi:hypothetical protein